MKDSIPSDYVFISYSRQDNEIVNDFIGGLQRSGIKIWMDHLHLKPGTANWEQAIRDAIRQSYAFILVASPNSRRSDYVQAEVAIAKMYKKPVYPLWIAGEHWIDCVPMELVKTQYLDARNKDSEIYLTPLTYELLDLQDMSSNAEIVISAGQLVYTRVESAFSPLRKSGYQTVFYTHSISETIIRRIEKHIQCFSPLTTDVRYQFFFVDEYAILTYTNGIETDRELIDNNRRPGVFLVHCLIVTKSDIAKLDNNPFRILDTVDFIDNVGKLRKLFEIQAGKSGDLTAIRLAFTPAPVTSLDIQGWTAQEMARLSRICSCAQKMREEGTTLNFVGTSTDVTNTLRAIFVELNPSLRIYCTFDTSTDRCPIPANVYWATGSLKRNDRASQSYVDIDSKYIVFPENEVASFALMSAPPSSYLADGKISPDQQTKEQSVLPNASFSRTTILKRFVWNNLFSRLVQPKSVDLICPRCLKAIKLPETLECPACQLILPVLYVDEFKEAYPFFIHIFGWSATGKTTFLNALTIVLLRLARVWQGYSCIAANQITQDFMQQANYFLTSGEMPQATQLGERELYIMILKKMACWGNKILIAQDNAGENFNEMSFPQTVVPHVTQVPTMLMFVSLPDLRDSYGRSSDMLLNNYINTLRLNRIDPRKSRRNLVVVLSKADLISDIPSDLMEYLVNDPFWDMVTKPSVPQYIDAQFMAAYLDTMEKVSNRLKTWLLIRDPQFANLINYASDSNISLKFSVISSTGIVKSDAVGIGEAKTEITSPRRVLDPYFWALEA